MLPNRNRGGFLDSLGEKTPPVFRSFPANGRGGPAGIRLARKSPKSNSGFLESEWRMHAKQMAEVAGWLSSCSELFRSGLIPPRHENGMRYWSASKCRLQRWQAALKIFEADLEDPDPRHDPWHAIEVLLQEILISDVLTRVWTALLVEHDEARGHQEMKSIGYSVFIGHIEARNRALRLMLHYRGTSEPSFDRVDALRQRMERWTDLLLSRIEELPIARQFAFDTCRVADFAADRHLESLERRRHMENILQASLTAALSRDSSTCSANPDLNRDIVAGVLACFPEDRFGELGMPKGLVQLQLEQVPDEARCLLQSLNDRVVE
jgi:hypothetical protein